MILPHRKSCHVLTDGDRGADAGLLSAGRRRGPGLGPPRWGRGRPGGRSWGEREADLEDALRKKARETDA